MNANEPLNRARKPLSASKVDTFLDCSQRYYANYHLKLPDTPNNGSAKGSVVHDILEFFLKPRRKPLVEKILADGTCKNQKGVWKLINRYISLKPEVLQPKDAKAIDKYILVALGHDFYGPPNTVKTEGEKEFHLKVDTEGKSYAVRGFIDKTFIVKGSEDLELRVSDYKSSKKKFEGDKATDNVQSKIYQLALSKLYPEIKKRNFEFLFLQFPDDPIMAQHPMSEEDISDFEYYLTYLQSLTDEFSEANATDNLAAMNPEKDWLCGSDGLKKDGTPRWICPHRKPRDYYVLLDSGNQIVFSSDVEIPKKDGFTVEKRHYSGCPYYFNSNGQARNFK